MFACGAGGYGLALPGEWIAILVLGVIVAGLSYLAYGWCEAIQTKKKLESLLERKL